MSSHTQDVVMEAWDELSHERKREIMAIPLLALSLISLLALLSYSPTDLAVFPDGIRSDIPIQNWIGKPGAWLANGIITIFGACGYSLPVLLLFWGVDRLRRGADAPLRKFRIAGIALLLFSLASFLGLLTEITSPESTPENLWRVSGAVGYMISRRLLEMGYLGALIVNVTVLSLAFLLSTPFLFTHFFSRVAEFLFPRRMEMDEYDDEENEEAYEGEFEFKGAFSLTPLREDSCLSYEPPVNFDGQSDWDSGEPLPSLVEADFAEEPFSHSEEEKGLRIITSEEEPLQELDLGVNLVTLPDNTNYQLPPISLLERPEQSRPEIAREEIVFNSQVLEQCLKDFNIAVKVVEVNYGPTITCYELEPAPGIKISRIENLANDITRALKACSVRIVAPIPGKGTVGVEIPNRHRSDVFLRELIGCESYQTVKSKLKIGLGKTISGEPFIFDLIKAPHLLVAGATGSGKSVCINTIITSLLYNAAPHEVKLLLVDPKQVELALYRGIPHLLSPVVTDPKKAGAALRWAVDEMETRYRYLKKAGVRNIQEYNKKRLAQQKGDLSETESSLVLPGFLPFIVIVIDELADLMMVVRAEVEAMIARLAAMARAVGLHLVLATQRPSVDVLTGVIKNNFPSRIAFQVSSLNDSRTILDMKGAESLLGRGDMLFSPGGAGRPIRLQGSFISTEEVEDIAEFVKSQQQVEYVQEEFIPIEDENAPGGAVNGDAEEDDLYNEAVQIVLENDAASTSLLQRRLKIGYGRAARLLDLMEEKGIVGPPRGSKPREIVLNKM
ncbi:MAG: DNA translocase FtsK [Candidatus Omnitrophota bacterium]|nr:MAG: DNA translocase FtsK [Candidatus Omnitrophota bacterium]